LHDQIRSPSLSLLFGSRGEDRPEVVGEVLPLAAAAGSPVFSIALAAVTFFPAAGSALSTVSFCAGGAGEGTPRESTFPPPADFSTLGAAAPVSAALSDRVLTGAAPVPLVAAVGLGGGAEDCCAEADGRASPLLAIIGVCRC